MLRLSKRRRVTAELIDDDDPRCRVIAQYPFKESLGCRGIAVLLHDDGRRETVAAIDELGFHLTGLPMFSLT